VSIKFSPASLSCAYADATSPEPLIAVIIITVNKINTTIAVITIMIGNQSVTPAIDRVVSFIILCAVDVVFGFPSSTEFISYHPIKEKTITINPMTKIKVTTLNRMLRPATPFSLFIFQ